MPNLDLDRLLALLRDPEVESQEISALAGVPREEAGRATRLLAGLSTARPEEVASLPGPLAAAVARAAFAVRRADLLAALAGHASRAAAKEAKRGLHLLRAKGVAVPEIPLPAPPLAAPSSPEPLPAYATVVDGRGERAVWIPRALPGKGIEVGQALLSDVRGLVDLKIALLGRKEWRAFAQGLLQRGDEMGVREVDHELAKSLTAEARDRNEAAAQRIPDGADMWLSHLGPAAPAPDPAERFQVLPAGEEADALAASAKLHDLPLLRGWLPDEEFMRGVSARLDEISVSRLYVDEQQRLEQAGRVVADAVEAYFDAARRRLVSGRLFAAADHLERTGDAAHARAAAAAARALRGAAPAAAIPFARLLVENAFPLEPTEPTPEAPAPGEEAGLIIAPR